MPGPYRGGPKRKVVLRMEAQFEALSELAKSGQQLSFGQDFFVKFYQAFLYADRWQQYIKGVGTTLLVTAIALVLGVVLGAIVAMIRVAMPSRSPTTATRFWGFSTQWRRCMSQSSAARP